ncbi:cob(I)yrinic acid a,c-diamide adenosyltransferase [Phascolarctobacterium sp. ET69]|uniref:cob(I)yrinic acid a,c-diamide adenosyltransferase n=1 Tax=Phascolarctobacterium sp. ET69 TaxID=2939420 RepID=UPI0020122A55|nr:cob(I)yrinic acid a,c-diamide adenosyltransferase [Phascolarctobacterium sp. ET69]MCL1604511.1 cob(I)yrinic acid a,c-diamide adenosyltransferase [Phascolarctobacterium sp. ET69]
MKDYGILQVYTGGGKGKTSAALGVAFRACARGARVLMLAFLKDDPNYSEAIGAHLLPGFTLKQVGRDAFVNFKNPAQVDLDLARSGWETAKKAILNREADLIILDEINIVLQTGMLPVDEVVDFLKAHKGYAEIICTGRGAPQKLCDAAGLVTDMQEVKHYFHLGVSSRAGIDF